MLLETTTFLGPARVAQVKGVSLRLTLPDGEVPAILATSYPYQPVEGDLVLAIGQEDAYYVIGVIQGKGKCTFLVPGDLEFKAPKGKIDLSSSRGIRLQSPDVMIKAKKLDLFAESVRERFGDACRWVKGGFQLRAGRVRQKIEGKYSIKAERIVERADKDVKIDGKKINLG